jgi:ATP-binding cassette subfamily B (MDR/TAP) protein 1
MTTPRDGGRASPPPPDDRVVASRLRLRSSFFQPATFAENQRLDEFRTANPVLASKAASAFAIEWANQRASTAAYYEQYPDAAVTDAATPPRVSLLALLSFSTPQERRRMIVGLVSAAVSGLSMPVWLLLLSASLNTFNNLGKLINELGGGRAVEILQDQLLDLVYSFLILGVVALFAGSAYVALWTQTGEKQALRICEAFVRSAFKQDARWYDSRGADPQELPTLAANSLGRISTAIGRVMADTFANLLSSIFCLVVAVGLDWSLALIVMAFLPVVALCIYIVSIYVRESSGRALHSFASAGAFATEVIAGIKTVASLSLESWAVKRYEETVLDGQKWSIRGGWLTGVSSGLTGFLFYTAYVIAFIYGTYQVAETGDKENSLPDPFYCMFQYCGISGGEVLV